MAEHSSHHPKVEGSSPAAAPGTLRDNGKERVYTGNTKGGSITVPLTSCLTGLD